MKSNMVLVFLSGPTACGKTKWAQEQGLPIVRTEYLNEKQIISLLTLFDIQYEEKVIIDSLLPKVMTDEFQNRLGNKYRIEEKIWEQGQENPS